jgi:hypothetical protein
MPDGYRGVVIVVAGLLAALIVLAHALRRQQAARARTAAVVGPLEQGARTIEDGLATLARIALPRELRVLLRTEVLARYRRIRQLHRGYPKILEKVADAERALQGEAVTTGGVDPIDNEQVYRRMLVALDGLSGLIGRNQLLQAVPPDVRSILLRQLGERKAELMAGYHLVMARRWATRGELARGRSHVSTLMRGLRHEVPRTPFVRALQHEAELLLTNLQSQRSVMS